MDLQTWPENKEESNEFLGRVVAKEDKSKW
jgi:hypothetical protein